MSFPCSPSDLAWFGKGLMNTHKNNSDPRHTQKLPFGSTLSLPTDPLGLPCCGFFSFRGHPLRCTCDKAALLVRVNRRWLATATLGKLSNLTGTQIPPLLHGARDILNLDTVWTVLSLALRVHSFSLCFFIEKQWGKQQVKVQGSRLKSAVQGWSHLRGVYMSRGGGEQGTRWA